MTALSAEDQRQRGERLGADRYLVKSQVGIEDVINTIHEVLGDRAAPVAPEPATPVATDTAAPAPMATPAMPDQNMVQPSATMPATPVEPVSQPAPQPTVEPQQPQAYYGPTPTNPAQ